MKALVVRELGGLDGLVYEDVPDPSIGKNEVMIDVRAAAVGFPDLLLVKGLYQFRPTPPFSPGGEVAGVVSAVGERVTRFAPGDAVVGVGISGGFAEKMALAEDRVLPKPAGIDDPIAASMTTAYGTMLHAYEDRAHLAAGETVLVLGAAGGVGAAAIELAKRAGARVIAAASSPEKLEVCRALGADETIDYARDDLKARVKALAPAGVDVVVDPVGGALAEPAFRSTAWNGRYLVIGFAAGAIPSLPLNLPLLKGSSIVGVFWGSFLARDPVRGAEQLLRIGRDVAAGALHPHVSKTYPLSEGRAALEDLEARRTTGRVVLIP